MEKYLALDIGGTFIKYGLVTSDKEMLEQSKVKTPKTMAGLLDQINELAGFYPGIAAIAISAPGAVSDSGIIYGFSALPYLHGPNVKELIKERTGMPVYMENDANCAAYAEVWGGSAKNKKDVLVIAIGTGIGGAVIKNGTLHKGANLHGGEFGYMLMTPPVKGKASTWSGVGSTIALVKKVAAAKGLDPETLSGEEIFSLAAAGDKICSDAINEFYYFLAVGIYNLQYVYDPELILIGGGISAREDLMEQVNKKLDVIMEAVRDAKIRPSIAVCKFRHNANLLGAVYGFIKEKETAAVLDQLPK